MFFCLCLAVAFSCTHFAAGNPEKQCPTVFTGPNLPCPNGKTCRTIPDWKDKSWGVKLYVCNYPEVLWIANTTDIKYWRPTLAIWCHNGQWLGLREGRVWPEAAQCVTESTPMQTIVKNRAKYVRAYHKFGCSAHLNGCSSYFWVCRGDDVIYYKCNNGLYFNPGTKLCDLKEEIVGCGGGKKGDPQEDSADAFCQGKPDGKHTDGCQESYYSCNRSGQNSKVTCPGGLFFLPEEKPCEERYVRGTNAAYKRLTHALSHGSRFDFQEESPNGTCGFAFDRVTVMRCYDDYIVCTRGNATLVPVTPI